MTTFLLHFERYVQQKAIVEVDAVDLNDAIEKASEMLTEGVDEDFEIDWEGTSGPRLYSVSDAAGDELVSVNLTEVHPSGFSWTGVCLSAQWGNMVGPSASESSMRFLTQDQIAIKLSEPDCCNPGVRDYATSVRDKKLLEEETGMVDASSVPRRF